MHSNVNVGRRGKRRARVGLVLLLAGAVSGCYYLQAARGHLDLMQRREPIEDVLSDPRTTAELRRRLELLREARQFAVDELGLPDNGSYRSYADLGRDYVVWNVFAAGEFSTTPETWCFPVAGCVAYRGYFAEAAARREAERLERRGLDVYVAGVSAYSTLGRFADPVLNTMMRWSDTRLAGTLFHELAHQLVYVKDDTEFNESFATVVADTGLGRWLEQRGDTEELAALERQRAWQEGWLAAVAEARVRLEALYASGAGAAVMRREKASIFRELAASPLAPARPPTNNAALVPLAAYHGLVGEFRMMLEACAGELGCFYREVRALADVGAAERRERLAAYRPAARR